MKNKKARIIAFYLPQFHPIPENDKWWGKGFTEWTNVGKAKALFNGHYQPKVPADLGYYDLRVPETRESQANLAKENGIEGFCYWHYWFGKGKQLLDRPFNEVLKSKEPNYPFCLGWANETWSGIWHGASNRILIEQEYSGKEDYTNHFNKIFPAFNDERYIRFNNKPIFVILKPKKIPDPKAFTQYWNNLAIEKGLKGIHFIAIINSILDSNWNYADFGFNAVIMNEFPTAMESMEKGSLSNFNLRNIFRSKPHIFDYNKFTKFLIPENISDIDKYPCLYPNWDNTPRSGNRGIVLDKSSPDFFENHFNEALDKISKKKIEDRFIFIKSWNEWAEGNYLEPDIVSGTKYLEKIRKNILLK